MLSLTFKNLWARKWRSFMTALAVVFGIALVSGTYVLTDTTNEAFNDIFVGANENTDVAITAEEQVAQEDGSNPAFDSAILGRVEAVDGVRIASGDVFSQGAILDTEGDSTGGGFAPQFIASASPEGLETSEYSEGRRPETPTEAALDEAAAERADLGLGDQILLVGTGKARPFTLVGLTRLGGASFGGTSIAQVILPVAQQLTGEEGKFDQISVAADDGVSPEELRDRIAKVVPKDLLVETGDENAERQASEIKDSLSFLSIALLAFAAISLFVGSFVIFNVFSITVAQRTREFGMLRTLGAGRSQILRTVLIEGLLIGAFASIAGILVGFALAEGLSVLLKTIGAELPSKSLVVAPRTIIVSLGIGIGVTLVASLLPALRATRVPPIAALSESLVAARKSRVWVRALISGLLAAIGLALIASVLISGTDGGTGAARIGGGAVAVVIAISVFSPQLVRPMASAIGAPLQRVGGLTGQLARENSQRNPSRTAVTSAALMIGLALVTFVTIFASGLNSSVTNVIDSNLKGQIILQGPGGFNPIPPEAAELAAETEGVQAASGIRYSNVRVTGDGGRDLSSVQPSSVNDVLELEWKEGSAENLAQLGGRRAVISEGLADSADLAVGDSFEVLSKTGRTVDLEVTGILASGNLDLLGNIVDLPGGDGAGLRSRRGLLRPRPYPAGRGCGRCTAAHRRRFPAAIPDR